MPGRSSGRVTTDFRGRRKAHRRLRLGMVFLTLSALYPGVWALLAPRSFFDDFPGFGYSWVELFPPYNEHLVRDVGGFYLGFGILLAAAAFTLGRRLVTVSLLAWLAFSIPHLIFHITHLEGLSGDDAVGQTVTLALVTLLPIYLLTIVRRSET